MAEDTAEQTQQTPQASVEREGGGAFPDAEAGKGGKGAEAGKGGAGSSAENGERTGSRARENDARDKKASQARRHPSNRGNKLKHLSRRDLLELLEDLSRENDRLRVQLAEANKQLEEQNALIENCGSIAEASLQLSGIFKAADRAAHIYVDSCKRESARLRQQNAAQPEASAAEGRA